MGAEPKKVWRYMLSDGEYSDYCVCHHVEMDRPINKDDARAFEELVVAKRREAAESGTYWDDRAGALFEFLTTRCGARPVDVIELHGDDELSEQGNDQNDNT